MRIPQPYSNSAIEVILGNLSKIYSTKFKFPLVSREITEDARMTGLQLMKMDADANMRHSSNIILKLVVWHVFQEDFETLIRE